MTREGAGGRLPTLGRRGGGWVAAQMVLLAAVGLAGVLDHDGWPESVRVPLRVLGVSLVVAGAALAAASVSALGSALTPTPAPLEGERLRTGGAYSRVRHPIYGALVLLATGFSLATSPWALVLAVVLAVVLDLKRRVEERFLVAAYPEYDDYRRRVPRALVPWIW